MTVEIILQVKIDSRIEEGDCGGHLGKCGLNSIEFRYDAKIR
jgi:hypothetical protein